MSLKNVTTKKIQYYWKCYVLLVFLKMKLLKHGKTRPYHKSYLTFKIKLFHKLPIY